MTSHLKHYIDMQIADGVKPIDILIAFENATRIAQERC